MSRWVTCVLLLLSTILGGCSSYEGDGRFKDHGVFASHQRYVIDLGRIDLTQREQREFNFAKVPAETFTFGLKLYGAKWDQKNISAKVRLVLVNEKGETIFNFVETISKWTWSGSSLHENEVFAYGSGKSRETVLRPGVFTYEPIGVGPDGGWGTYVSMRTDGRYKLIFENVVPDPNAKVVAVLMGTGGGWK
jgi:hypothetical protein